MERSPARAALRRVLVGLGVAAALGAAYGGWRAMGGAAGSGPVAPTPRGIILICFDTLRADAFALPGEPPGRMPVLEAFARDAVVFDDATSACSWTAPSVTSLLTGLRPADHGVESFGQASPLIPAVVTLAESLQAAGWSTAAVTGGGWVSPDHGMGQGFDLFATNFDEKGPDVAIDAWDRARSKDRPFFLLLHTYAAHDPYGHEDFRRHGVSNVKPAATLSADDLRAGLERGGGTIPDDLIAPFVLQQLTNTAGRLACQKGLGVPRYKAIWHDCMAWLDGEYASTGDRLQLEATLRTAYRDGLPSADDVLHETFERLRRIGVLDTSDVIVVGDHGEAFGEHRSLCHGFNLYDEVIRVPLVVRARGRLPKARRVSGSCSLLDVVPTILDLAGVEGPPGLEGRSLVAFALEGGPDRPAVADLEHAMHVDRPMEGRSRYVSVRTTRRKWICRYDPAGGRVMAEQLFDLTTDPGEQHALLAPAELPPTCGMDFCLAVARERNRIRRVANLPAAEPGCASQN